MCFTLCVLGFSIGAIVLGFFYPIVKNIRNGSIVATPSDWGWLAGGLLGVLICSCKYNNDQNPGKNDCFYQSVTLQIERENTGLDLDSEISSIPYETAQRLNLTSGIIRIQEEDMQGTYSESKSFKAMRQLVSSHQSSSMPALENISARSQQESTTLEFDPTLDIPTCSKTLSASSLDGAKFAQVSS